jgi:fructosamine-3-kinase
MVESIGMRIFQGHDNELGLAQWCAARARIFYPKADLSIADDDLQKLRSLGHDQLGLSPLRIKDAYRHVFAVEAEGAAPLPEQGTFHRVFRVWGPAGSYVLRANALPGQCRGYLLHLGPWLVPQLRRARVPVLPVYAVDTSRTVLGLDYEMLAEAPWPSLQAFNEDEPRMLALFGELGALLAQAHAISLQGWGLLDIRPLFLPGEQPPLGLHPTWRAYLEQNLGAHVEICVQIGAITGREGDVLLSLWTETDLAPATVEGCLLHGDLGSHNVLSDGSTVQSLIDWEDCLVGDPVFDVALWATFQPERRHSAFVAGYRSVRALPADFERRFWLYYLRVALAKTVHRYRFGYADRPGRPPAAQRIRQGLDGLRRAA